MRVDIGVLGQPGADSKIIDRIYACNEMTFGGSTGIHIYDVSLVGVTAALAEVDVEQGRYDRSDANARL